MSKPTLTEHFKQYFRVIKADTDELKNIVYKIRYDVYAKELHYEKNTPVDREQDHFDSYSQFALVKNLTTGIYAGCVRLVIPPEEDKNNILPFEQCCIESADPNGLKEINSQGRLAMGEISRLAVLASFRRRKGESSNAYGVNIDQDLSLISDDEMRLFPFIAVALYLSTTAIGTQYDLNYVVVMMEPRLARLLNRYGIQFTQIGKVMEYHGQRALFYSDKKTFFKHLKPELLEFYEMIKADLG